MLNDTLEVYSLPQLQNRIKKDPGAYLSDFELQLQHFYSTLDIFRLNNQNAPKEIFQQMIFIAQTSPFYSKYGVCNTFIEKLINELKNNSVMMTSEMRVTMVTSLILLSNQKIVDIVYLLPLWFELMRLPDKNLRSKILKHIISSIVDANGKGKRSKKGRFKLPLKCKQISTSFNVLLSGNHNVSNNSDGSNKHDVVLKESELRKFNISLGYDLKKFNTTVISFLRERLNDSRDVVRSLTIFIEVHRQNIWNDSQTVNIIANCCLKQNTTKVVSISAKFLLGKRWSIEDVNEDVSDEDEKKELENEAKKAMKSALLGISNSSRKKKLEKAKKILKRVEKKESKSDISFMARSNQCIDLIHNPQEFSEELFQRVVRHIDPFEVRQLLISLISRLIERHKLILINYYSYLGRYLSSNNKNVINILANLAQACHDLIPPQELSPVIKIIMDNFVNECNRPEVIIMGLNAIREICCRIPTVLDSEKLMDLSNFRNIKNKGISIAAKSLINLYRDIMPSLLHRSLLNKESALSVKQGSNDPNSAVYGHKKVENSVSGTDLLMRYNQLKSEKSNIDLSASPNLIEEYNDEEDHQTYEYNDSDSVDNETEEGSDGSYLDSCDFDDFKQSELEDNENGNDHLEFTNNNESCDNTNIAINKILDQDDFRLIKKLRTRLEATKALGLKEINNQENISSLNKDTIFDIEDEMEDDENTDSDHDSSQGSDSEDLCKDIKIEISQNFDRKRKNKQQRIQSIMKGRENRETFKEKRIKGKSKLTLILIIQENVVACKAG